MNLAKQILNPARTHCLQFVLFCMFFLISPNAGNAQIKISDFNNSKHYTSEDGMASTYVSGIQEDKYGFLWIATGKGISRYDGVHFTNFTTYFEDSLKHDIGYVTCLLIDAAKENLWIACNHGILHTSIDTINLVPIDKMYPTIKNPVRKANDLLLDKQGKLWTASFNEGRYCFDLHGNQHERFSFTSDFG